MYLTDQKIQLVKQELPFRRLFLAVAEYYHPENLVVIANTVHVELYSF